MKIAASDLSVSSSAQTRWQDYLALLKPRVMSVVVFTAVTGFVCAGAPVHPAKAMIALICIAVGAGASGALNMWYEADIDRLMRRTRSRPIPAGRMRPATGLAFGLILAIGSVVTMDLAVNGLASALLFLTIFVYVVVYTIWLKRSTPQNIVIGGLAGALPPAVGWAAASGAAPLNAWLLVAIIFFWTPPHFWALALLATDDYRRAGVPMMPVVKGERSTRRQIVIYSLILAALGVAPAFTGLGGHWYFCVEAIAGAMFVGLAARLVLKPTRKAARRLFAFSIVYVVVTFAALLVGHLGASR